MNIMQLEHCRFKLSEIYFDANKQQCLTLLFLAPLFEVTRKVLKSLLLLKNLPIYKLWPQHVATGTGL